MKAARVLISKDFLEVFVRAEFDNRRYEIKTNAPKDLEILGFATSKEHPFTFEMYVKSESFSDIPENSTPPLIDPFTYTIERREQ